ncbi:ABC transporter ATP-binding protein [Candidatus Babeliales bacterium]|nr:ABC transporter ATP-binding protein [Candidatus Babeliales bacterium]
MYLKDVLFRINSLLMPKDRLRLLGLLGFSVLVSLTETTGITLMLPFISLATNFDVIHSNYYLSYWYHYFGCSGPASFITILGCVLVVFYTVKNIMSLWFIYGVTLFSQDCFYRFSSRFFAKFLRADYLSVMRYHSAKINKMVLADSTHLAVIVNSAIQLLSEMMLFVFIYVALLWVNLKLTLVLTVFFSLVGAILLRFFSREVALSGVRVSRGLTDLSRAFYETFANFKIAKLAGNEKFLQELFDHAGARVARAHVVNMTLQSVPRPLFEVLGLGTIIAVLVYVVYRADTAVYIVPILSAYALAFYRFLTSLNRVMTLYNQMIFAVSSLDIVNVSFLRDEDNLGDGKIPFQSTLKFQNVSFHYKPENAIFEGLSFSIRKGDKVAFVGESGSGKSTLIDLITGICAPLLGNIIVDGQVLDKNTMRSWRSKIGYVPQSVYLFDGTVAENIVFGRKYDEQRICESLKKAHIFDFLTQRRGIHTEVGEAGTMLSGGQRQRIAIARALYNDPEILILDEATSSLDYETESAIMEEVYQESVGRTLIIVAHRLSTIQRCDYVYEFGKDGVLKKMRQHHGLVGEIMYEQ